MPLMRRVSNTAKTSVSSGVTWNSQSLALGLAGQWVPSHRTSDKERPTAELAVTLTWHDELMAASRTEPLATGNFWRWSATFKSSLLYNKGPEGL